MSVRRVLVTGGSGFIGTHLVRVLEQEGVVWTNVDVRRPVSGEFVDHWQCVDLRDSRALADAVRAFSPTHVIHLAARTDTDSSSLAEYDSNTVGTLNLIAACRGLLELGRFVFASTQFVLRPGVKQTSDVHFDPHTVYGTTKAMGELCVRASLDPSTWVIVRPTNIWGPWHPRYGLEFWRVLDRGLYVHPSGRETVRTYGYVGTIVAQMWAAATLDAAQVSGHVFYLGDPPIRLSEWVDGFSQALRGEPARRVPRPMLRTLARGGDAMKAVGLRAPLTSSRFRSMTEDYITPVDTALSVLGPGPVDLREGIAESVAWYRAMDRTA